jgi:hypothetical protein
MINSAAVLRWRKAKRCTGGNCVEVAEAEGLVLVRNSKVPEATLTFTAEEWETFLHGVKEGDFSSS